MSVLRYIGHSVKTFVGAGELEFGSKFPVPEEKKDSFLRRNDIEDTEQDEEPSLTPAEPVADAIPTENEHLVTDEVPADMPPQEG